MGKKKPCFLLSTYGLVLHAIPPANEDQTFTNWRQANKSRLQCVKKEKTQPLILCVLLSKNVYCLRMLIYLCRSEERDKDGEGESP